MTEKPDRKRHKSTLKQENELNTFDLLKEIETINTRV